MTFQAGAFDLPSIAVGVLAVGILALGVMAAVFGVIPWTQDNAARQDLTAVRTAEGVSLVRDGVFYHSAGLANARYLPPSERVDVAVNTAGTCYVGLAKSATGKMFYATNSGNDPRELTPTTAIDGKLPGCLPADTATGLVASVGGFDTGFFSPIGSGAGTDTDPGNGIKAPETEAPQDPAGPGRVTGLAVFGDSVDLTFQNTSAASYRMPYRVDVACRNTSTGAVSLERISGYFDLASNEISTKTLVICMLGTTAVDVSVPTYANDSSVLRWRTSYQYPYAEPVARGVAASAFAAVAGTAPGTGWCLENRTNASADGNPVDLAACASKDGQRWQWSGDGVFRQSTLADKCLTADAAHTIVLGTCSSSANQRFKAEPLQGKSADEGIFQIRVLGTGECVTIPGGLLAAVQLATAACDGTAAQSWYLPGLGLGGATVQPATAAPFTVISLGSVSSVKTVNTGSDLSFAMGVTSYSVGKPTATHVTLTCLNTDKTTFQVNELRSVVATSITGLAATPQSVSCGDAQIIAYSVKPVTRAGLRTVSNPLEFKGWSPALNVSWDAASAGYTAVGSVSAPLVTSTGSDLTFNISFASYKNGYESSTHYELTCMGADLTTYRFNDTVTAMATSITGGVYPKTLSCGEGQIIEYTLEPLTLDGLKETDNIQSAGGYTNSGTFRWAAADGYPVIGNVSAPTITNAGSDLTFTMYIGSYMAGKATSTHYTVTCRDGSGNTRLLDDTATVSAGISGISTSRSVSCGVDKVAAYALRPLTLDGLKETDNPMTAGGYTTSGAFTYTKP